MTTRARIIYSFYASQLYWHCFMCINSLRPPPPDSCVNLTQLRASTIMYSSSLSPNLTIVLFSPSSSLNPLRNNLHRNLIYHHLLFPIHASDFFYAHRSLDLGRNQCNISSIPSSYRAIYTYSLYRLYILTRGIIEIISIRHTY
jgi:hypothetical protein